MEDLSVMFDNVKQHFENAKADTERFLTGELPQLGSLVSAAASNPVVTSVLKATHISPEILAGLATVIDKLEADLAAAEAAPPPAPAEPEPPAEPAA